MKARSFVTAAQLAGLISISGLAAAADSPAGERSGYSIEGDRILFVYISKETVQQVFVAGNFMDWERSRPDWQMTAEERTGRWLLELPLEQVTTECRFVYVCTF